MAFDSARARQYLQDFDLKKLFVEVLGWDNYRLQLAPIQVDEASYSLNALVESAGWSLLSVIRTPRGTFLLIVSAARLTPRSENPTTNTLLSISTPPALCRSGNG
jgi:hypothetical protein